MRQFFKHELNISTKDKIIHNFPDTKKTQHNFAKRKKKRIFTLAEARKIASSSITTEMYGVDDSVRFPRFFSDFIFPSWKKLPSAARVFFSATHTHTLIVYGGVFILKFNFASGIVVRGERTTHAPRDRWFTSDNR